MNLFLRLSNGLGILYVVKWNLLANCCIRRWRWYGLSIYTVCTATAEYWYVDLLKVEASWTHLNSLLILMLLTMFSYPVLNHDALWLLSKTVILLYVNWYQLKMPKSALSIGCSLPTLPGNGWLKAVLSTTLCSFKSKLKNCLVLFLLSSRIRYFKTFMQSYR